MRHSSILIIDDEDQLRKLLGRILTLEGFEISEAIDIKTARQLLNRHRYEVILCDVKLPDGNGLHFMNEIKEKDPVAEVIILTAYGNIADGVAAIKQGAFDYITKGDDNDRIIPLVNQAMEKVRLSKENAVSIREKSSYNFDAILGNSPGIKNAIQMAKKIAVSDSTVLLLGETGTGKEVFANAIHGESKRKDHAFIAINCSAFTKELLEGELFGHKAGAYTGALKDKKGLIELADKGTLFLDEIGEMNIELQAKLLRVLENGEFIKLGDTKTTRVSVRWIAATNRDLKKSMMEGSFREDLYYRLNVFSIHLPALRERRKDIRELADFFVKKISLRDSIPAPVISDAAIKLMQEYDWKGNIRELKNLMERAVILQDDATILPEHLPYEIQVQQQNSNGNLSLANVEKSHIFKMLQYSNYNKTKTAEILGIGLTTLYRKMEEYNIPK